MPILLAAGIADTSLLSPMATYCPDSILLEGSGGKPGANALRLHCKRVTLAPGGVVVDGVAVRHLLTMAWNPEYLSFELQGESHRFRVISLGIVRPDRALFLLT